MDSEIEFVKVMDESKIFVRTKNDRLADDYYNGKVFLTYNHRTYYCFSYGKAEDGYNYMRMVTDE